MCYLLAANKMFGIITLNKKLIRLASRKEEKNLYRKSDCCYVIKISTRWRYRIAKNSRDSHFKIQQALTSKIQHINNLVRQNLVCKIQNILENSRTFWNCLKYSTKTSNLLDYSITSSNLLEYSRIYWNIFEYSGTFWNILE